MQRSLDGIIPAIHTAFGDGEEVDFNALRDLIRRLVSEKVHGLFVCGTSGEFPFLSLEEREKLVELVAAEASGQVAIIVHVGAPRPRDAIRLAQHAAHLGVQALASVPPYYYSYRRESVLDYIREVASSTDLPFFYYHIPERTGVDLDERLLEKLASLPNLAGLKYSHTDLAPWARFREIAGPRFRFLCGSDEIVLPALSAGAVGAIGSTFNFLAPLFVSLWQAFVEGRWSEAMALQARANRIIHQVSAYPAVAAGKEAVRLLGIDLGQPRPPQSRLDPGETAALRKALIAVGVGGG